MVKDNDGEGIRHRHDSFAKDVLEVLLSGWGETRVNVPVVGETQYIDFWFEPNELPKAVDVRLELLVKMCQVPCAFEPFRRTPGREEVRDCIDKQMTHHRKRRPGGRARLEERRRFVEGRMWLVSPGSPDTVIQETRAVEDKKRWMEGFYDLGDTLNIGLVVVRRLPRIPQTLIFRLMGRGVVQENALIDVMRHDMDDPLTQGLLRLVLKWGIDDDHEIDIATIQELVMDGQRRQEIYDAWERNTIARGREQGIEQGREQGQRESLLEVYKARFGEIPPEVAQLVGTTRDPDKLTRWLTLFATADSPELLLEALRH